MTQTAEALTQQSNPKMDLGFYASVPRIVRTGYKDLTPTQKWLYACLKDLCGDYGTCYRSLRTLREETGISTGMLSESIPLLHKSGLIHAEKQRRATGGKEVWHITIVDIWQANGKEHPTKCSQNEQTLEVSPKNVHRMNKNVHTVNNNPLECSHSEQECSLCETEGITDKQEHIEVITDKQKSNPPTTQPLSPDATNVATNASVFEEIVSDKETRPAKTTRKKETPTDLQEPQGKPTMPEESMPWSAEKIVQITECLRFTRGERGAFFSIQSTGKSQKSQRDRQLVAAKKILVEIPTLTESEYVAAYSEQNNDWWNREKGSLTVEDMAASTPRKVMRVVELLEKVRTRSEHIKEPAVLETRKVSTATADRYAALADSFENRPPSRVDLSKWKKPVIAGKA